MKLLLGLCFIMAGNQEAIANAKVEAIVWVAASASQIKYRLYAVCGRVFG